MINPECATIAIKGCQKNEYRAEHIKWKILDDGKCCEFYSKFLLSSIANSFIEQNRHAKCYIQGQYISQENLVVFCINEATSIWEGEIN